MPVKIVKAEKYDVRSLEYSIRDTIEELRVNVRNNKNKKTAILKPNIVIPAKPKTAIITHPYVVEAVVNVLEEKGFEDIIIGEGPGLGVEGDSIFDLSGYKRLNKKKGVRFLNLNKVERVKLNWKYGTLKVPKS
jgi:uncharacterized protein (DUF362 family)